MIETSPAIERQSEATGRDRDRDVVDLIVNCHEGTYRDVLRSGFFPERVQQSRYPALRCIALVNNVDDRADAGRRAQALKETGEIADYHFVADHIELALQVVGLERRDLEPIPYYTDWALVAVTLPGSRWLLCWDAQVTMVVAHDWISPAIELLEHNDRVVAAMARPDSDELTELDPSGFGLGCHGLSDQLFLVERSRFAAPIYRSRFCPATYARYPLTAQQLIFEARTDAWIRWNRLLIATHGTATYHHPRGGGAYRRPTGIEVWKHRGIVRLRALLRRSPLQHPCFRL